MPAARWLDLGCGGMVQPGFLGLDRFPLAGVGVVADLDAPHLPFGDDQFELVLAVHSLEHVANLMAIMREIWRVARPGAQVVILAPYSPNLLDAANPFHLQSFNEHTPRFWTEAASCPIDQAEWVDPPLGAHWGLARSDNNPDIGFDLRCVRMELFYVTEYWHLPEWKARAARKHQYGVCEQILYHLLVFKPPMTEESLATLTHTMEPYIPLLARQRRALRAAAPHPSPLRRWLARLTGRGVR